MKACNQTKNTIVAAHIQIADSFLTRMKGLLGRSSLSMDEGLYITRCNSIHMIFMKFAIDVIFLDQENKVVGLVKNIQPFRLSAIYWRAKNALEVPVGTIDKSNTEIGDILLLEN